MKSVKAFAPATIANFNVGYDVLGVALSQMGDMVELTFNEQEENKITSIIGSNNLPTDVHKNCCSVVISKMQQQLKHHQKVDIKITKGFASGSGLGSSSASSAAAAFAYNQIMGNPFPLKELVFFAAEGERIACGSAHTDNVAPSLLGGIVLAKGNTAADLIQLPIPPNLFAVTFFPNIEINTADAREILNKEIPLRVASQQVSHMGAFVKSLYTNDLELLASSLKDWMVEPARYILIPKFLDMKQIALKNGALSFGISGSGPSVFAITKSEDNAQTVCEQLHQIYKDIGIDAQSAIHELKNDNGAKIIQ